MKCILSALLALLTLARTPVIAAPPNFLLLLTDDHGYGDVSAYHASDVRTPNIDRIGAEGMLFTTMRANCTVCSPSRVARSHPHIKKRANLDHGVVACPERERIHRGIDRVLEIVGGRPNCAMVTDSMPFETPLDKLDNIRLSKDYVAN
jgi:hypothetical protein